MHSQSTASRATAAFLLLLLPATCAHAEEQAEAKSESSTSEEARQDKSIMLTIALDRFAPTVELGYFLRPNQVLVLELTQASYKRSAALRLRSFVGNSFYLGGGLGYADEQSQSKERTDEQTGMRYRHTTEQHGYGLDAVLGNQWQWDRFTIGCDWTSWGYWRVHEDEHYRQMESGEKLSSGAGRGWTHEIRFAGPRPYLGLSF